MRIALGLALLLGACVHIDSADCGGDKVCREGTVCARISFETDTGQATDTVCVSQEELDRCKGLPDGMECDDGRGTCYSQACLPIVCGDSRIDRGEGCDDGKTVLGDGCSATCQLEVCGNGIVDPVQLVNGVPEPKEQCDDGNSLSHDGCASSCLPEVLRWRKLPTTPAPPNFSPLATNLVTRTSIMFGGFIPPSATPASVMANPSGSFAAVEDLPLQGEPNGDTWQLSATGWTRIDSIPSPSPRGGHALATDGTRTVLVGGARSKSAVFDDVWALTDGTWRLLGHLPSEMGPRAGAAMAYSPKQKGFILFGGIHATNELLPNTGLALGDTWFLADGTDEFVQFQVSGDPEPRVFATLTYDPDNGTLILVGGTSGYSQHVGLGSWSLDGHTWTTLPGANPPTASGAVAAYDPAIGIVVAGGMGKNFTRTQEVTSWRNGVWSPQIGTPGLNPRYGAAGTVDPITGHLQMFGGLQVADASGCTSQGGCTDFSGGGTPDPDPNEPEILTYDTGTRKWSLRGIIPSAPTRLKHSYTVDEGRGRVVVFGGYVLESIMSKTGDPTPDGLNANVLELSEHTWFQPDVVGDAGKIPDPRHSAAFAYADFGSRRGMYMFGGSTSSSTVTAAGDFWFLGENASKNLAWKQLVVGDPEGVPDLPAARSGAGMVYDSHRHVLVMFGGSSDRNTRLGDTCEFNGSKWTCKVNDPEHVPAPRADAAFAYDPKNHLVLMWGGIANLAADGATTPVFDELWSYDGTAWKQLSSTFGPSKRRGARFAWDARRERMVLWGGDTNDASVWECDGSLDHDNWSFAPAFDAPQRPRAFAMLVQSPGGDILAHGGSVDEAGVPVTATDVLALVRESTTLAPNASCTSQADEDHDGKGGCNDLDCWTYCTPWCAPGTTDADCVKPETTTPMVPGCGNGICEEPRENCGICPADCHQAAPLPACPVNPEP